MRRVLLIVFYVGLVSEIKAQAISLKINTSELRVPGSELRLKSIKANGATLEYKYEGEDIYSMTNELFNTDSINLVVTTANRVYKMPGIRIRDRQNPDCLYSFLDFKKDKLKKVFIDLSWCNTSRIIYTIEVYNRKTMKFLPLESSSILLKNNH